MSVTTEVPSGLEDVVAFAAEIAEPDREGGALRYRGVDLEEIVSTVPFGQVWGLLVDGHLLPGLPPAEPHPLSVLSGDHRVDVQSALAMLAPQWGLGQPPVPQREIDKATQIAERFLIRWRGEADPKHVEAIDAYWISAAEHGINASTFTARVVASTGADVAAALSAVVGALSGPLHGGAPSRVLKMLDEVEATGDPEGYVKAALDRGERLMGFKHRIYRAEDPRARVVVLDFADVPPQLLTQMFTCARTAGWSAHILEQKREGRLIRPMAKYIGPGPRPLSEVTD